MAVSAEETLLLSENESELTGRGVGEDYAVRELVGRGRGLVALRGIPSGKHLASYASYSYMIPYHTYPQENEGFSQCCSTCLCWSSDALPVRCEGCPAAYCSPACHAVSYQRGHQLCCAALKQLDEMGSSSKWGRKERSCACFLLRAFAQRASEKGLTGDPSFEDATSQCLSQVSVRNQQNGSASLTEKLHQRAIRLARLHAEELISGPDALRLLRAKECNSFFLFDEEERHVSAGCYDQPQLRAQLRDDCLR